MLSPQAALAVILKHTRTLARVSLPCNQALGHCLGEDIRADRDLPPADHAAMDGYAVRAADLTKAPRGLRLIGEVAGGSPARLRVRPGTCVRIMTGANVPPGADTVVMVEHTAEVDGRITVQAAVKPRANIFIRGENAHRRSILIPRGTTLGPLQIGVTAAVGKATVKVHRRPRVTLLCTGAALREVHEKAQTHETRNSNGPLITAALAEWGYGRVPHRRVPDSAARLAARLRRSLETRDVGFITGGVSIGKYDFVREAIERAGATIRFHGIAMKPGKPLLYATLPRNRHVFGLPGNPLSAMLGFYEFGLPALRRLSGFPVDQCRPCLRLPTASRLTSKGGRTRFVAARLQWENSGPCAIAVVCQGSADLVAGGRADGVIAIPPEVKQVAAGELVDFRPWRPLP